MWGSVGKMITALGSFHIEGINTNLGELVALLQHPLFRTNQILTRFLEDHDSAITASAAATAGDGCCGWCCCCVHVLV